MNNWENFSTTVTGTTVPYNPNDQSHAITSVQAGFKKLEWLRICRIPLSLFSSEGAFPGHYWIEIINSDENNIDAHIQKARSANQTEKEIIKLGNVQSANGFRESYGWYPINSFAIRIRPKLSYINLQLRGQLVYPAVQIKKEGIVNGASDSRIKKDANNYRDHTTDRKAGRNIMNNNLSKYAFDPDQYLRFSEEKINIVSNPYLPPEDNRTKEEIIQQIRNFASTFHSKHSAFWSWNNDGYDEVNCHTFLFLLLGEVGLADPIIANDQDKHFRCYFNDINCFFNLILASKAIEARRKILTNLKNLSLRLVNKN